MAVTLGAIGSAMLATSAGPVTAAPSACYTVQHGDTAALVSWRLTGSAQQQYQPWFQIVDAQSRVVPKSHYNWIHAGWRACIPSTRIVVAPTVAPHHAAATAPVPSRGILETFALSVAAGAWWGVAVLVVGLLALDGWQYLRGRQAIVSTMQQFGERFVWEFERPLRTPGSEECPVESQLRVIPRRQRLEIHLAPTGRRRYPNFSDHRTNVTYDAERIVRQLNEKRLTGGQLSSHGKWVVIACDFKIRPEQKGRQ